jgi:choline dehydrogenase
MAGYDYIVIGAGTAGCVVAARVARGTAGRVLLLEAGTAERTRAMTVPDAWPDNLGSAADWNYQTTPQADTGPVPYPRGRALGGSGAINAMAHIRGHRAVYDAWPAGWRSADLLPYFKRSENALGGDRFAGDAELRGTSGPVTVAPVPGPDRHPVAVAFAEGLHALGFPYTSDLSGAGQEGVGWPDLAIADGRRVGPAEAYLTADLIPNLTVATGCLVTGLTIRGGRCTGVSYRQQGAPVHADADGEVILCAGAIGTPQLLMLSGIGPAAHLREHGIEPVADLSQVGQNLQDHPMLLVCYATPEPVPRSRYNHGETYSAVRSGVPGAGHPDLHLFPILVPMAPPGLHAPPAGYNLTVAVMAPDSTGSITLADASPGTPPLIDPGLLREGADVDRLEAGVAIVRDVARTADLYPAAGGADLYPGQGNPRDYIRHSIASYFHASGTCRLGEVTDLDLRVLGVDGLRIADASVMPSIPNANTNATVLAIAERAAELISVVA